MTAFQDVPGNTEMGDPRQLAVATQRVTPTTGQTVNANSGGWVRLMIVPAGLLLALTVRVPQSPQSGDIFEMASTQAITVLTMTGGTILGSLGTVALNGSASWVFDSTSSSWVRTT